MSFLLIGSVVGFVAAVAWVVFWMEPLGVLPVLERLTPNIVYRVRTELRLVALSFDDGPNPTYTPQVLDLLQQHGAKATFFLTGERVLRHPELVARIRAEGHEIGNHYFKNGSTLGHSKEEFLSHFEETERAIASSLGESGGKPPQSQKMPAVAGEKLELFRPPGGVAWPQQIRAARERGYTCVLGCAYPHDPMHPPVWYIRWLIEKNLVPGTIVILHDGIADARRSIAALPRILGAAGRKGLRFVSIGELLGKPGGTR